MYEPVRGSDALRSLAEAVRAFESEFGEAPPEPSND
jgi:hypothetical protein